ncbi:hypothetical protein LINPERHAP1_LOCUS11776 [Linum perenne]
MVLLSWSLCFVELKTLTKRFSGGNPSVFHFFSSCFVCMIVCFCGVQGP